MPTVSVITAVYNTAPYLDTCVRSMLAQTYTDWELLLLDDGSTDEGWRMCQAYAEQDSRIRAFHHENHGVAYTRNRGFALATGTYLCVLDPDDYLDKEALSYLVGQADATGADIVLCGLILETAKGSRQFAPTEATVTGENLVHYARDLKAAHLLDTCVDKLYRRSFVEAAGVTMPQGEIYEDTAFNLELLTHPFTMVCRAPCFYHYVRRPGSITKRYNPDKTPILKKRWQALCRLLGGNLDFCAMYYIQSVYSALIDEYLPAARLSGAQRRERRAALLRDEAYADCLKVARACSRSERVTLWVARRCSQTLTGWYCYACYLLKYRFSFLFLKLK